jgi:hypothetical protein
MTPDDGQQKAPAEPTFREELKHLINRHSMENGSNTPDHLLAAFLSSSLEAFDRAVVGRDHWYGKTNYPGGS